MLIGFADLWVTAEIYIPNFWFIERDLQDKRLIYYSEAVLQLCECCYYKLLLSEIYNLPIKFALIETVFSQLPSYI